MSPRQAGKRVLQAHRDWTWEVTSARCAAVILSGRVWVSSRYHHLGSAPTSSVYTCPGAAIFRDILVATQGLEFLWPRPHFQSRGCASFRGLRMQCFRLLCKLAGIMAPLGSQLKAFQPIKRKHYVF